MWKREVNYTVAEEEEGEEEDDLLLMAEINEKTNKNEVWYIDSGCSNHMCKDEKMFNTIDRSFSHPVKLGNYDKLEVKGRGNVRLSIDGAAYTICEVYYVPKLKSNLLSVGQLQEKGLTVHFKHGACSIYHQSKGEIIKATMKKNRMFAIHIDSRNDKCITAQPKQRNWRASKAFELIHSDICGPITPASKSGKNYFLTFIDDFSLKGWVFLLTNKSEALDCFKKFKRLVEKESGQVIKNLRTDRGAKNMPKFLWSEAIVWSVYVLNRCPTISVKGKTPQEAWNGRKPVVDYLKVWGCLAHDHVPKVNRGKLDKRSTICVFLGISEGTKGYRLYNTETRKIVTTKDVVFEEQKAWDWKEEGEPDVELQ
ncbi:hypothetical protein LIER_21609 [Lithospermum erythrorhizon]|uniref:Integrase catalytic domain-containing protein n=1 Tax=Lithospermum erythrorhizon TaxID=34254 RepID=A0AAV3QTY0_LITER